MKYVRITAFFFTLLLCGCKSDAPFQKNQGYIFGTSYHFTYQHGSDMQQVIVDELQNFNRSLSTYDKKSIISRINQNDSLVIIDKYFKSCFETAQKISKITDGAFDMTVAPVVNAWGFGFDESIQADSFRIDSLMKFVGYHTIRIQGDRLLKNNAGTQLDASAIAKGMGVDVAAEILESKGIENYMVEIGGEVRAKGINPKGTFWRIGIDKPIEDVSVSNRQLQAVVALENKSLATSGNYRQFYEKNGVKYSHTIDPKTGYPARTSLLSASVLSNNCMTADAYATAFMVLGTKKSIALASKLDNIEIYLIFADSTQQYKVYASKGFQAYLN